MFIDNVTSSQSTICRHTILGIMGWDANKIREQHLEAAPSRLLGIISDAPQWNNVRKLDLHVLEYELMEFSLPEPHLLNRKARLWFSAFLVAYAPCHIKSLRAAAFLMRAYPALHYGCKDFLKSLPLHSSPNMVRWCGSAVLKEASLACVCLHSSLHPVWFIAAGVEGQRPRRPMVWAAVQWCHWLLLMAIPAAGVPKGVDQRSFSRWSPRN